MESDRARWDDRYGGAEPSPPAPPVGLHGRDDLVAGLPRRGRALDIACGTGGTALWFAARGLDVLAIDVSPRAIELTSDGARSHRLSDRVTAVVHDLDHGLPDGDGFDVVVCQNFRDPALYGPIVDALRPGGVGVVTVLSESGLDGEPGPFHAPAGELRAAFTGDDVELLHHTAGDGRESVVVRRPA